MSTPEERARKTIDDLLRAAGWQIQSPHELNLGAALGVAVREFSLRTGFVDYLLFVERKAIGAVEAKAEGTPLSGIESQSEKYSAGLPAIPRAWRKPLPFLYESTGVETFFSNGLDPEPRSRRVFAFHKPETLLAWVREWASAPTTTDVGATLAVAHPAPTFRAQLRMLPPLPTGNLWGAQIEAITNLEKSLADDRPRALIQMATGSGKTFTAVSSIYRLIKFAGARRVLFLVDRGNLGRQTLKEFQQYVTPDDGRKFSELYNVQHLQSNSLDSVSRVCITTIQRLYSMLSGDPAFDPDLEERSLFDLDLPNQPPKPVRYNPALPIEYFDVIVTDECHRSIYNLWRQVLEYFDAHLIGLTATPSKQTFGFFNQNLVMEYPRQRAVADGVNVDGQVYRIRTQISQQGSTVEAGYYVEKRDKQTRRARWEQLDEDFAYDAAALDRAVVAEDQIRTVIRTYRDRLFIDLFPGRSVVPKTLIFAKDDSHAENIVRIAREEFGKGNDFCRKITYTAKDAESLIASFRNSYDPRIAVTVDMIATGTDIKPLEVLLFMRPVRSRVLFEQMLGRGTRVINPTDLQAVTPGAALKDRFIIVDAVGVVESAKVDTQTLERRRSVPFDKLLQQIALGAHDEDTLVSLAGRLAKLERTLTPQDAYSISAASGGKTLKELANTLLDATDPDSIHVAALEAELVAASSSVVGRPSSAVSPRMDGVVPAEADLAAAQSHLLAAAVAPFDHAPLRSTLVAIQQRNEQTIDRISMDRVNEAGFSESDTASARATVASFQQFITTHRDEIAALQLIFSQPQGRRALTYRQVKELAEQMRLPPNVLTTEAVWQAYARLEKDKVRGAGGQRVLTDLIALVRHVAHPDELLEPYPARVQARYQDWLAAQAAAGRSFSAEQRWWLDKLAENIGVNVTVEPEDLNSNGDFANKGGPFAMAKVFGKDWRGVLMELNEMLAA